MTTNAAPNKQKDGLPPQLREIAPIARLTNIPPKQASQNNEQNR